MKHVFRAFAAAGLACTLATTAMSAAHSAPSGPDPDRIELPAGFQPEGIATGPRGFAWFGSRADGDVYRANLSTGKGKVISQGPGTPSLGLKLDDDGRLFVSGGTGGDARVIDGRTGKLLASYVLATPGASFINDVVLTRRAAWFTDSENAQLFKLPLGRHGKLPEAGQVVTRPLVGEWQQLDGVNANGLVTSPDRRALLVVNSATGELFRVRKGSGEAVAVDLKGAALTNGDGLLREGRRLYVVQNRLDQVAVVRLNKTGTAGRLKRTIGSDDFDVPTTIARWGDGLYLPNARFTTPAEPTTPYWVTRITG